MTEDQMSELASRAHKVVQELGFSVYKGCSIDLYRLSLTPSWVKMETTRSDPPKRRDFKEPEPYKAAYKKWQEDRKSKAHELFPQALARLKKAKIRYRVGTEYGWPVARLA